MVRFTLHYRITLYFIYNLYRFIWTVPKWLRSLFVDLKPDYRSAISQSQLFLPTPSIYQQLCITLSCAMYCVAEAIRINVNRSRKTTYTRLLPTVIANYINLNL